MNLYPTDVPCRRPEKVTMKRIGRLVAPRVAPYRFDDFDILQLSGRNFVGIDDQFGNQFVALVGIAKVEKYLRPAEQTILLGGFAEPAGDVESFHRLFKRLALGLVAALQLDEFSRRMFGPNGRDATIFRPLRQLGKVRIAEKPQAFMQD